MVQFYPEFDTIDPRDAADAGIGLRAFQAGLAVGLRRSLDIEEEIPAPPPDIATVVSLTLIDKVGPSFLADSRQWTIETFSMTNDSRLVTKPVYGRKDFFTEGLGINPSVISLALQYAPLGPIGLPAARPRQRWYAPLRRLKALRTYDLVLRIGGLTYGVWTLKSCPMDFQNMVHLRADPHGHGSLIAPRIVRCNLSMTAVNDDWYLDDDLTEESLAGFDDRPGQFGVIRER